jgi:hypothetical protein
MPIIRDSLLFLNAAQCFSSTSSFAYWTFWKRQELNIPFLEGSLELEKRLSLGDLGGGAYPSCGLSVEAD